MISTVLESFFDKRIKPGEQWTDQSYPIMLTYKKTREFFTCYTLHKTRKMINQLDAYVNLKLKAQHFRTYPPIYVGNKVNIYTNRRPVDKSHVLVWSDAAYEVENIPHSHGLTFYTTSARYSTFLCNDFITTHIRFL